MNGYALVFVGYEHPMADANGCVYEHRLVMVEKLGRLLTGDECVHHRNGDKLDNRPGNLELTDNARHLRLHNAKLTEEKVREIRARLAQGVPQANLAAEYNVCDATISHVNTRRWWKHVT